MNNTRMRDLAVPLATVPEKKFDMRNWITYIEDNDPDADDRVPKLILLGECGTAACVAGWAVLQAYPDKKERVAAIERYDVEHLAKEYLGLSTYEAGWLFMGKWGHDQAESGIGRGTNKEAVMAINAMIEANGIPLSFKLS